MPITPQQYRQIEELYNEALKLKPEERESWLDEACRGEKLLRDEVLALLSSNETAGSFLNRPAFEMGLDDTATQQIETKIGKQIGHYRILAQLGSGGMGEVYRCEDLMLGREVAIKFMNVRMLSGEVAQRRFFIEAQAAARLDHPNICAVYEIGRDEDLLYIAMQYIEGETLAERIRRGPIETLEALTYVSQIADALRDAHDRGIIHRDIKPHNIMITSRRLAKLLDFGLARISNAGGAGDESTEETMQHLTAPGKIVGTVSYMSPEQASGEMLDARTDLFSLGVVFYEMLTATRPFSAENSVATLSAILTRDPDPISLHNRDVPTDVEYVIQKLLAKKREARYQTAAELLDDVAELIRGLHNSGSVSGFVTGERRFRPPVKRAIAVLPFADMSPKKDQDYFCEGMAEEVINALSQVEGLSVVSRSSAFQFQGKNYDLREIGETLRVSVVLEGSVRQAGNRLRIAARLVNVADGYHIWSESYDCEMKDVFDIQDEISRAIVQALKIKLVGEQKNQLIRRYTDNIEAYHLYLKGRHYWNKRVASSVRMAMQYFQEALAEDPEYALAYAGIADCYIVPGYYGLMDARKVMPLGREAALKAISIDDKLGEAYCTLGMISSVFDFEWLKGDNYFRRAQELTPSYANSFMWHALFNLVPTGRLEDALKKAQKARELDPLNAAINTVVGATLYYQTRYVEAIEELRETVELAPDFPIAHYYLAKSLAQTGDYESAVAEFERTRDLLSGSPVSLGSLGWCYAMFDRRDELNEILGKLNAMAAEHYVPAIKLAEIHLALGEHDRAIEMLEKGFEERSSLMIWVMIDPIYEPLREDKRYQDLLRRMGLSV